MWGSHGEAVCRPCSQSYLQLIHVWCNFCSLPEFHCLYVRVSSRTPVYRSQQVMLRDALISLCCLQLPKKCQCFSEREDVRMVMSELFSPLCQSRSFRILNGCTGSKQGRWSVPVSRHYHSAGKAMPERRRGCF